MTIVSVGFNYDPFSDQMDYHMFNAGMSVNDILKAQNITGFECPTGTILNHKLYSRKNWDKPLQSGDQLKFVAILQGGGGGGGKSPIKTVLSIALLVAAPYLGGLAAGAAFGSSTAVAFAGAGVELTWATVFGAVISAAGNAVISAVLPNPTRSQPSTSFNDSGFTTPTASPTFSYQSQGTTARLLQPIAEVFGRHIIYPDFAATPYTDYTNNEQDSYQLHVVGKGYYDIEQIRIEDTPISSFSEIQYQIIQPNQNVTLFNPNRTTAIEVAGQSPLALNEEKHGWIGPFTANPAQTIAEKITIHIIMVRGLYYANDSGGLSDLEIEWIVEARKMDDFGNIVGGYFTLGQETFSESTNTPQRLSFTYSVQPGRYQVRIKRLDDKNTSSRAVHEFEWGALQGHIQAPINFGDVTMIALKLRASNNLSSQASRKLNLIVQRKLPIWSPHGWSEPTATKNPIWAAVHILRSQNGGKLPDNAIDLVNFHKMAEKMDQLSINFNTIFDQYQPVLQAVTKALRVAHCATYQQFGIHRVIRDEKKNAPRCLFTPRNITKGSFEIEFSMPDDGMADAVIIEFFSEITWRPDEVTVSYVPSDQEPVNPTKLKIDGCTEVALAEDHGKRLLLETRLRRRVVKFTTGMEGFIPTYGDLIRVTHPLLSLGSGGEIVEYNPTEKTVILSEPVEFVEDKDHYLALRGSRGEIVFVSKVTAGQSDYELHIEDDINDEHISQDSNHRTHYAFGPADDWAERCIVIETAPRSGGTTVLITAVVDDDRVYSNDLSVLTTA